MKAAAVVLTLALSGAWAAQETTYQVTRIVDGDTIEIEWNEGQLERVRYIGIDTPEMNDSREIVREHAQAATEANRKLVEGQRVSLEFDVQERDRYGRLLAYVWLDTLMVNEWLLREGYASVATYPPDVKYVDRFIAAASRTSTGEEAEDVN